MTSTISAAIRESLQSVEAVESVERVKDAVTDVLRLTDPAVKVVRTHFFNHTYSPDFMLEWPSDSAQSARPVYLRSTNDPSVLREDLDLIDAKDSMFVQLFMEPDRARSQDEETQVALLAEEVRSSETLMTQTESLEALADARTSSTGAKLFASSVVRGGRGLLVTSQAEQYASAVEAGFDAAGASDREPTAAAVAILESSLDGLESRRLKNVLQAVWVSSGASVMDFPSDELDLSSRLSAESLSYLLGVGDITDAEFWHRLARNLELDVVMNLGDVLESDAFQQLMLAAGSRLQVKSAAVRIGRARLDPEDSGFRWSVERGLLTLRGHGVQSWFAPRAASLSQLASTDTPANPGATQVQDRARRGGFILDQLEATNGSERLSFSSETSGGNLAEVSDFQFINSALGQNATIRRVAVRVEGQHINANFEPATATTNGRGKVSAGTMAVCALSLLTDLSQSARTELEQNIVPDRPTPGAEIALAVQ